MKRTLEQWANCDPQAMATQSEAAIMYAFKDAKDDIAELGRASTGKIGVLIDLLRDVMMPLSISKMDALTSGEEDDYRMIGDLEKRIKSAISIAKEIT